MGNSFPFVKIFSHIKICGNLRALFSVIYIEGNKKEDIMVRNANQRINKYISKLDPEVNKERYEKLKEQMVENIIPKLVELSELDIKIKAVLDNHPDTIPTQYFYYFSYCREIWRLRNKYCGIMLYKLISIAEAKWEAKGLNKDILEKLRIDIFNIIL